MNATANNIAEAVASGENLSLSFILEHAGEIQKLSEGTKSLRDMVKTELDAIAEHKDKLADAINASDTKRAEQGSLWRDVARIADTVAKWAKDNGMEAWAGQAFLDTVRPVMPVKEKGEKLSRPAATVASYLSTGRAVVTDYLIKDGLPADDDGHRPEVTETSYNDIRALYRKPGNEQLDALRDQIVKQIREFAKYGTSKAVREKMGENAPDVIRELERIAAEVKALRDPVMAAKDATSKASEASRELEAGRQQRPTEAGTVETTAKPEAQSRAA